MVNEALDMLLTWGVPDIARTLGERTRQIAEACLELGLHSAKADLRVPHFLGLSLPDGVSAQALARSLAERAVHVSVRGSSVRITPHLYNTDDDTERLLEAIRDALRGG